MRNIYLEFNFFSTSDLVLLYDYLVITATLYYSEKNKPRQIVLEAGREGSANIASSLQGVIDGRNALFKKLN